MPPRPKPPPPPPRPNPLRNVRPIRQPTPIRIGKPARPAKRTCSNKECETPDVHEDGICHNCGTVVEESNIVSEVTFGETSQGAAVVQGSYMAADQGHVNTMGKAFKNMGQPTGDGDNAASLQDARRWMQQLQAGLDLSQGPQILDGACNYYKLAARQNFIQGRRMDMVAAVCLYSFCRSQQPCRVMLIDFADQLQVNVFKLGHTFKALNKAVSSIQSGLMPVLPEDLIWRFAHKLDFKTETNKVAEDAVRLVKRMSLDWMVMGRRPSGVCGACLILAARMNNFRRTVTEVVYVVKVTTATIQKRLDEFKRIPSSALTVEEFLSNEFLESAHDPPSYYEKQESFIKTKKTRKRKRKGGEDPEGQANAEGGNPDAAIPSVELRRDADGFAIPPQPTQEPQRPEMAIDPALLEEAVGEESGAALKKLVHAYGDAINDALSDDDDDEEEEEEEGTPGPSKREPKPHREIHVPDLWAEDERTLESQIDEIVGDPNTIAHARAYARACKRANKYMKFLHHTAPQRDVNMDVHIGEDEFADDPEVVNALLGPADVAAKERVWVNENKSWLRKQQLKEYQKRIAADGPPKATRNRKKKPRIGEGQEGPANTPEEAAIETLKRRTWSKKINYKMVNKMLSGFEKSLGGMGSAGSSRAPSAPISEAGSMIEDDDEEESENGSVMGSVAGSEFSSASSRRPIIPPPRPLIPTPTPRPTPALSNAEILARGPTPTPSMASKDDLDLDLDGDEEDDEEEDWKKSLKRGRGIEDDGEEDEEDDYAEDYTQGDVMEVDEGEGDVDAGGEYEGNWDAEEDLYGAD